MPIMVFGFSAFRNTKDYKENILQDNVKYDYNSYSNYCVVRYSIFVKELKKLGFILPQQTFEEMISYYTESNFLKINQIHIDFKHKKSLTYK